MTTECFVPRRILGMALVALFGLVSGVASFQAITTQQRQRQQQHRRQRQRPSIAATATSLNMAAATSNKATLTEETTWTMRMNLENLPTEKGKRTSGIFVVQAKFVEEEGYEPPQGLVRQVVAFAADEDTKGRDDDDDDDGDDAAAEQKETPSASASSQQMTIGSGRWTLSEDPEDRKDSLWIWGLFKEPLYPFLLLQFEIEEMSLPGEEKDSIKPFKLYAQINHKRGDNGEVILASVTDLAVREKETIKADPFGAAKLDLFENVVIGKLQLQAQP